MRYFDVFNGDADGICALHQLRLERPRPSRLVTGVKRDNALLARVPARAGDSVTVLDISLSANREALERLLAAGVQVEYFDHHQAPTGLSHPGLLLMVDPAPDVCTSILADRFLGGRHRAWAVAGAFGDAMPGPARTLAATLALDDEAVEALRRLGECINYNGYGDGRADQMYSAEELYRMLQPYPDPMDFMAAEPAFERLARQYEADLARIGDCPPLCESPSAAVFRLADAPWARRMVGTFANRLVAAASQRAYAVLVPNSRGKLTVSLRVPAAASLSAEGFAQRYGGGGRRTAAGINDLAPEAVEAMARDFLHVYGG